MTISTFNTVKTGTIVATLLLGGTAIAWAEDGVKAANKPVTEQIVDVQTRLAKGPYPGFRANHAKGILASGTFTPASGASDLSKAAHLQSSDTPVIVRFSNAGGLPTIADTSAKSMPKGMAIRFRLPDGSDTDIVSFSVNRFPVSTPEQFLGLLNAIAASGPDAAKPTPLEQFLEANPTARTFVKQPKPIPQSFATQTYHGVNAFKFTNSSGKDSYGRYRIIPIAGEKFLNEAQLAAAGPDYLMEELAARLQSAEVAFRLIVQIAGEGDAIDDPTKVWPDDRPSIELGTLQLKGIVSDYRSEEQKLAFNPLLLTDGIEPSNDLILQARPAAYAVSVGRRAIPQ